MRSDAQIAREVLDERLAQWRDVPPTPPTGWIRAIRQALGMSSADLARRLGTSRQAVLQMEASEADDSIRLGTLRRAAEALDGRLVYVIVPTAPLEAVVDKRAREIAEREVESIRQTMRLENQLEGASDERDLVEELAQDVKASRRLWRD